MDFLMNIGIDLSGNIYGYLTVIRKNGKCKKGYTYECQCDCGKIITVQRANLVRGHVKSCGCKRVEMIIAGQKGHKLSKTRLYKIYYNIIGRCTNPKNTSFKNYGEKGIDLCPEWKGEKGFINFYNWAMQNNYSDTLTIDRIDNNLNYSPSNCRWVSQKVQQNNRSNNHVITYDDKSMTISQWADYLNVPVYMILNRLKRGRSDIDAIGELYESR